MKTKTALALMVLVVLMLAATAIWAQSVPVASNNQSGTIAVTNTFQPVQMQTNNRIGCTIQNGLNPLTSSRVMYVFFDKTNSANCSAATEAASVTLAPGQPTYCAVALGYVLKDQICITGTSGDPFFANFQ